MATRSPTHYEILGLGPGAKHTEVGIAYNRLMAARRGDNAAPDAKAEARLRQAFEVLSDLDKREAYDRSLRAARIKPAFGRNHAAMAALFIVAAGAGLYWYLRPQLTPESVDGPAAPGKPFQEILNAAIPAVGRLQMIDMSGKAQPAGVAFAVEEGVLVTSCQGISPTAQLNVDMGARVIAARVTQSDDALGLCKLEVPGAGSWPLSVSPVPPKAGDRVYATQLGAKGEVVLREGKVKRVKPDAKAAVIEVSVPFLPQHGGAPLLDMHGRVVAVANMPPDAKGAYVHMPVAWAETPKAPPAAAKPAPAPEPEKAEEVDDLKLPGNRRISPERRQRLEKAFRPPPNVPDDL